MIFDKEKMDELLFLNQVANEIQQMDNGEDILARLERMKQAFVEKFM